MFSLQNIAEEAKPIILAAAKIYYKHTKEHLIGIVIHGSVITKDFIPCCSDIDIKLILNDTNLELSKYYEIHKELSKIEVTPFRYIQCDILSKSSTENNSAFISGTYEVIYGDNSIVEMTPQQLIKNSIESIRALDALPKFAYESLLDHGGQRLSQNTRLMITKIWPALKNYLIVKGYDPILVWRLSKLDTINELRNQELKSMFESFYDSVTKYYPEEKETGHALDILRLGIQMLGTIKNSANVSI